VALAPSRVTRRRRALDGDLPRFNDGAPGGWPVPLRGVRLRWPSRWPAGAVGSRGAGAAPGPPWPGGPKSGPGARRATAPGLAAAPRRRLVAPRQVSALRAQPQRPPGGRGPARLRALDDSEENPHRTTVPTVSDRTLAHTGRDRDGILAQGGCKSGQRSTTTGSHLLTL